MEPSRESDVYAIVVGGVIAGLRKRLEVTQADLADQVDLTQSTLSRIERGLSQIDPLTLNKVARAFGMTPEQLNRKIQRAYAATEESTTRLVPKRGKQAWWKTALKVAGVVGVVGVAAFAIAKVLDEDEK